MEITIDFRKTVDENATIFFEKAKKARKKLAGAEKALERTKIKLKEAENKEVVFEESSIKKVKKRKWFEKFKWFVSSDKFLIIGGRDATTNEIIIKKHAEQGDLVFHTDMAGSPFIVIKSEGKKIPESTIQEAADFTAVFSRGWKKGLSTLEVFYVNPDQVTKEANQGEYLAKGSFMIRGKTNYTSPKMNLAVGIYEDEVMAGPVEAIKKHCKEFVEIVQGEDKTSDTAKKIKKIITGDLDDIIRVLPAGGCKIKK
jgi:predicted ribosome quality control (RQC) complex YloA/Tae2 family protein